MCFGLDSTPPQLPADLFIAPMAGGAGSESLQLTGTDGTVYSAALAQAAQPQGPGVVILPDVRGLYRFYVELAERFAEAGHHAIAVDYFGRTAGVGERDEDFEFIPHVAQTEVGQVQADATTALATLRERTGASSAVTVGFCFGGTQSYMAATNPTLGFDGYVAFYGALHSRRPSMPSVLDHVSEMRGPILGLFGGADDHILPDQVAELEAGLTETGVEHEIHTYPGAPHSFFDRKYEEFQDDCADAWRRVLGFLDKIGAATTV